MKKVIITAGLLALIGTANAQWNTSGSNIYNTNTGNVGVGTVAPINKIEVHTPTPGDGVKIVQTNTGIRGSAALHLDNSVVSGPAGAGKRWALLSTGPNDASGNGNFSIYDWWGPTGSFGVDRFFIKGSTGHIGIGTTSPTEKLDIRDGGLNVEYNTNANSTIIRGAKVNVLQTTAIPPAGPHNPRIAIEANASNLHADEGFMYGVIGNSSYGLWNTGGKFEAYNGHGKDYSLCIGVEATAIGSEYAYGLYATATGGASTNWAGYFNGNVYSSGSFSPSDRKLKNDIKPVSNIMERVMKLKPSSYTYKIEEFEEMQLPKGNQIGLIAQELAEVFPELTMQVAEFKKVNKVGKEVIVNPEFTSVNYVGLVPILIAGIQEQQKAIDQQNQINSDLQKQLNEQKQLIAELSQKSGNATGLNNLNAVENGFQMSQNEPNPFTHETVVKYTLPQTINTAFMTVYDLTGKQITTFPIRDKGTSSITITSQNLAAGIYIYSIVADGKVVDSKRMIVADK